MLATEYHVKMAAHVPWTLQLKDTVVIADLDSTQLQIVGLDIEYPDQVLKRKRCGFKVINDNCL